MQCSSSKLGILLRKCRLDQQEAKEELCAVYYDFAKSICDPFVTEKQELNDLINDGFAKAFRFIDSFRLFNKANCIAYETWLHKMLLFAVIDYLRNHLCLDAFLERDPYLIATKPGSDRPDISNTGCKSCSIVRSSVSARLILHLHLVHQFTVTDFSQCFGMPVAIADRRLRTVTEMKASKHGNGRSC